MTSLALGLHQKLVKQGVNPQSDEYYEKINSRMRQLFPEQFTDELLGNDEDRTFGSRAFDTAFNEMGLGRFKVMANDRIREEQIKRLQDLAAPYTKEVSIPYIPESQRAMVPKNALDAFELARQQRSEIQKARRDRRKPGAGPGVLGGNPFIVQ